MRLIENTKGLMKAAGISVVSILAGFGMADRARADVVPADFRADTDAKKIEVANYDSVTPTSNWDNYYGTIKWDNDTGEDVSADYRVWVLDEDKKPCGMFDINTSGFYGFLHAYEDDNTTPSIDEGANIGDIMDVLVENKSTGEVHKARYNPETPTFQGDKLNHQANIKVDPNPIPEPAAGAIILAGLPYASFRRRRRK